LSKNNPGASILGVEFPCAFSVLNARQWTLLLGDGSLREPALAERIETHGVPWLFDMFAVESHVDFDKLLERLSAIFAHPRCRMPSHEVHRRLAHFAR